MEKPVVSTMPNGQRYEDWLDGKREDWLESAVERLGRTAAVRVNFRETRLAELRIIGLLGSSDK